MASTTWNVNKDSRIADNGSNLGAGASDYLPVGLYSGYQYRSLLGFAYSFSGMVSITQAVLHIKTSSQFYVAFGSSPSVRIQRITSSWSEGTSVSLSGSNAVVYPGPSVTTTNAVTLSPGTAENTWKTADITGIVQDAFTVGTFHGIRLIAWNGSAESTSASDVSEFYAREYGSNDAYIVVTYTTNTAPSAPTLTSPAAAAYVSTTPTLAFTHVDSDGDALLDYDLQVSTDSTFASVTHWNIAAQTTGITGNNVSRAYAGTALTRGTTYYWRARTSAATGVLTEGTWSAARSFTVAQLPTVTLSEPVAAGRLVKLTYTAGSGWTSPRISMGWDFACPDGGTQASYEVDVANDSAGSVGSSLYASGAVSGTAQSLVVPAALTEGDYYHIRARATCSHGETSSYSGYLRTRARWGVVAHRKDLGSAPTSWSVTTLNTTIPLAFGAIPIGAVVMEYGSDTAANATPVSGYLATLAEAPLARYFFYRAWLLSWGSSPATSASLDKLVLSYSANILVPDKWTRNDTTNVVVDESTYVYGTQSLKITRTGSDLIAYQTVSVTPDTDYILSGRIKSSGNSRATIEIVNAAHTTLLAASTVVTATQEFTRVSTPVWNSGANTAVIIRCHVPAAAAAGSLAWFDALKFEASKVVTPWSPSFLADAVVLDAGGLQIDAVNGGIFRLRGSSGGTRDRVDLGSHGLKFGGDIEVYSPAAKRMLLGDASYARGGTAFPASPASGDIYYRTDLNLEFFYDGTRWLSTTIFATALSQAQIVSFSATTSNIAWAPLMLHGGSDLYLLEAAHYFFVNSGGTALGASHSWALSIDKSVDSSTTLTTISTGTLNSGANGGRRIIDTLNTLLNNGTTHVGYRLNLTKVGTPGAVFVASVLTYRVVAT